MSLPNWHESATYRAILNEGAMLALTEGIRDLGEMRFGKPDEKMVEYLEELTDLDHLRRIRSSLLKAIGWKDLLDTP